MLRGTSFQAAYGGWSVTLWGLPSRRAARGWKGLLAVVCDLCPWVCGTHLEDAGRGSGGSGAGV